MSDINTPLNENIGRMQLLSQESEQALSEVNQLNQLATALIGGVAEKEQRALTKFESLILLRMEDTAPIETLLMNLMSR